MSWADWGVCCQICNGSRMMAQNLSRDPVRSSSEDSWWTCVCWALDLAGDGSDDCASEAYDGLWMVRHTGSCENNGKMPKAHTWDRTQDMSFILPSPDQLRWMLTHTYNQIKIIYIKQAIRSQSAKHKRVSISRTNHVIRKCHASSQTAFAWGRQVNNTGAALRSSSLAQSTANLQISWDLKLTKRPVLCKITSWVQIWAWFWGIMAVSRVSNTFSGRALNMAYGYFCVHACH